MRAPERKTIYAQISSLLYNKIKKQSNIISAKKVIAKCTSYPINTANPHPFLPISTTALIAPRLLPDKIFIIYRWHPDRRTHLSIPMCPSHSFRPCPRIFVEELGGDFRVWVVMVGGLWCHSAFGKGIVVRAVCLWTHERQKGRSRFREWRVLRRWTVV
jgi:hypothetical protein